MSTYIDGFVFPVPRASIDTYRKVAEEVAAVWKEHGAISYNEFVGDDLKLEGTRSFLDLVEVGQEELVIFGFVTFPSKEVRDEANRKVPQDPRMQVLVKPLLDPDRTIFDASRMVYGGFRSLIT